MTVPANAAELRLIASLIDTLNETMSEDVTLAPYDRIPIVDGNGDDLGYVSVCDGTWSYEGDPR